jgi:hypothetical protein
MKKLCPRLPTKEAAALRSANDSVPLFRRLVSFAARGCQSPETLTPYEIEQVSFALLSHLALSKD